MNEIKKIDNDIIALLHNKTPSLNPPKPYEREIFLFETYVAGTTHIPNILDLEVHLKKGDHLKFRREPDNPYDEKAIVIRTENGAKIGYVPKADNIIFSRLMDAGKLLFGKIDDKEILNNWVKIYISVYLLD
ncbi:MAG: HIRAN domain-containing protein [Tissierellia bacterium]|nr:HIRAN domain-containing protein [Tissierellia bacterium]